MRVPLQITSADNPRIKQVLHLRKNRDRRDAGVFIAEGKREIERALAAGLTIRQFFLCRDFSSEMPEWGDVDAEIFEVPSKLFLKMAYLERPEGWLAVFDEPMWKLDELPDGDLWLIATGIEKPGNLGAMTRTAAAAGCAGMIVADEAVDAFNANAIRASTGAVFSLPIVSASSEEAIAFCQNRGIQIVAAMLGAAKEYSAVDWNLPTAIVIGAEDVGLSPLWQSAGIGVEIPMAESVVDSLNASTAAAILLFEAVRQRRISPESCGL
jgi:RNA methyltransferase, TrmH family